MKRRPDQHQIWTASKAQCQRQHAIARAKERYGVTLTLQDMDQLVKSILDGKVKKKKRKSCRVKLMTIFCPQVCREVPIVFDEHRQEIVTFLPEHEEKPSAYEIKEIDPEEPRSLVLSTQVRPFLKAFAAGKTIFDGVIDQDRLVYRYSYMVRRHVRHIRIETDLKRTRILKAEEIGRSQVQGLAEPIEFQIDEPIASTHFTPVHQIG